MVFFSNILLIINLIFYELIFIHSQSWRSSRDYRRKMAAGEKSFYSNTLLHLARSLAKLKPAPEEKVRKHILKSRCIQNSVWLRRYIECRIDTNDIKEWYVFWLELNCIWHVHVGMIIALICNAAWSIINALCGHWHSVFIKKKMFYYIIRHRQLLNCPLMTNQNTSDVNANGSQCQYCHSPSLTITITWLAINRSVHEQRTQKYPSYFVPIWPFAVAVFIPGSILNF